ncbi:MAG: MarR family transcriptional regulator [Acetatifactor sp.]|nr:MarR family transcriptional regulator [Acetatifactor sp.]MDE5951270.1 MarR family transcriptional regulator [Acetatifactor sp.]
METRTGFLISQVKQVQNRIFQRLLTESGVEEFNGPQGRILYVLWQEDGVPIAQLVQQTGLAKSTLTAMLARMEDIGLITRENSSADKRQVIICLTDTARGLQAKYEQVSEEMNQLFYRGMTQEDADTLDGLLGRVLANLQELL